jgi:hypothetical protein
MSRFITTLACAALMSMLTGMMTPCIAQQEVPDWVMHIRSDHPRLFFNSDTWPKVRERALTIERDYYEAMKVHAQATEPPKHWTHNRDVEPIPMPPTRPGSECQPADWGGHALSAAFVYRIEPSPELLKRIRDMLWATVDYYHACYAANMEATYYSTTRLAWLAAMDWVWDDLDPAERTELGLSILAHADEALNKPGIVMRSGAGHTAGYYGARNMTLFTGLLLHNEGIDDDAALKFLLEGWGVYQKLLELRGQLAGDDGATASPTITYSLADYPRAEWNLIYALRSAADFDLASEAEYLSMMPNYVLWNWIPPGLEYGYGDVPHLTNRISPGWIPTHMNNIRNLYAYSSPQWAQLAGTVSEMIGGSTGWLANSGHIPYPLLQTELEEAPEPIDINDFNLPMARHFEAIGQVFMRSGSGPDDTYALFAIGGLTGQHRHYDSTHFTIYKHGYLALDTGTRQGNTDNLQNYYGQTIAHNCILIKMPGEKPSPYWNGEVFDQAGGQNKVIGSEAIAFETDPYYSYVAGDATPVYNSEKCQMMVRQFFFLPPDHFVVFDRVVSTQADYAKTWLMHHANEPVFDGNTWYSDQDRGRIFCRTLLPADAALEPVGGPGKEFLVEGVNYSLTAGASTARDGQGIAALTYEEVPELMGRWRVEVRPGTARTHDAFLHLIQVGDQSLQNMSDAQVNTAADGTVTLTFDASGRTVTLSLPTTGDIGGHIGITEDGQTLVDRPLAQEVTPQEGMAAQ